MKKQIFALCVALFVCVGTAGAQIIHGSTYSSSTTYQSHAKPAVHYQGEVSFGFATGGELKSKSGIENEKTDYSRVFLSTVHGVRITPYAFVGLGAGVQYAYGKVEPNYDDTDNWNTVMIPLFLNLKGYYPVSDDFAPYVSVSVGSSICATSFYDDSGVDYGDAWESKLKGGFYGEYGIGFNYRHLDFGLGLLHQNMKFTETYDGDFYEDKCGVNSFFVKIGVKF